MTRPVAVTAGLVARAVLGAADIAALGAPFAPPLAIRIVGAVLGVVTLVRLPPRGGAAGQAFSSS